MPPPAGRAASDRALRSRRQLDDGPPARTLGRREQDLALRRGNSASSPSWLDTAARTPAPHRASATSPRYRARPRPPAATSAGAADKLARPVRHDDRPCASVDVDRRVERLDTRMSWPATTSTPSACAAPRRPACSRPRHDRAHRDRRAPPSRRQNRTVCHRPPLRSAAPFPDALSRRRHVSVDDSEASSHAPHSGKSARRRPTSAASAPTTRSSQLPSLGGDGPVSTTPS